MKILSIGNSFSQDAHKWLHKLAKLNGVDIQTSNLCIGGWSLEGHWKNASNNSEDYAFEVNGGVSERKISITEALKMENWDAVTLQQVSDLSGLPETYEPYLLKLAALIRNILPDTKLMFHQTWAYETDSEHSGFLNYNNNQQQMYNCIIDTTENAAKAINAEIIPVGRVVQYIRENIPEFNYKNGGISLCRDGFHLSFDYGRFIAAATWLSTLSGTVLKVTEFEDFDINILKKIIDAVNKLCYTA